MSLIFQKVREQLHHRLPFVCYNKPNSDKIVAHFQKGATLFDLDYNQCGFAFVSFDNQKRYLFPETHSDLYFETISESDFIFENTSTTNWSEADKADFEKLVQNGVDAIHQRQFEKVVLSRKETFDVGTFDVEMVFKKLIFNYKTAFNYCIYHPQIGFWMGATPEQFLKIEEDFIKTVALAGTQLNTGSEQVKWNNKEIEEQQIVTDFIVDNLSLISKKVTKSNPYNIQAGSLIHIKTDIEAKIENHSDAEKIINLLHPTPALCGFPKLESMQFILENEGYDREFYGGFLGEWNKDYLTFAENKSDLFVNLRCMKVENKQISLYTGCGVTKDSNPEKEFFETVNKAQTIKKVL
ncbi:isochorismate synthase [Flavobacterium sp.]|uniref:isochorismate synthase n=1 Tax=Flavobacterium sp. TaxID=239 RepID=UPI00260190D7|nr:isochorismate synthase [Flavobacterium sp.]